MLHPGTVGGWSSDSEGSLFSSQLSTGQWLITISGSIGFFIRLFHDLLTRLND